MKRAASIVAAALMMVGASAGAASAALDWGIQPDYDTANGNTICADHCAFGAFGKGYNMGVGNTGGVLGANGPRTRASNSTLCGQPHN